MMKTNRRLRISNWNFQERILREIS